MGLVVLCTMGSSLIGERRGGRPTPQRAPLVNQSPHGRVDEKNKQRKGRRSLHPLHPNSTACITLQKGACCFGNPTYDKRDIGRPIFSERKPILVRYFRAGTRRVSAIFSIPVASTLGTNPRSTTRSILPLRLSRNGGRCGGNFPPTRISFPPIPPARLF